MKCVRKCVESHGGRRRWEAMGIFGRFGEIAHWAVGLKGWWHLPPLGPFAGTEISFSHIRGLLARTAQSSGVRRCNECACFALLTTSIFNTTGQTHKTRNLPQTQALGLACMRYSACVRVTWCDRRVGFQHPPRDTATGKR